MATSGFDKWNWKPGNNDTPQAKGVTSLLSPYKDASPINGKFDIYKTTDGKNTIYLAFDAENNMVAEEVKQDGGNWKIKYEGVVDGVIAETLSDHEKAYMWKPTQSSQPVVDGKDVKVTMMDGTASKDTFTIYEYETGKFLAYQTMSTGQVFLIWWKSHRGW